MLPLAAGLGALYLCFLTATHYWDGVLFSLYIEKASEGLLPRAILFHPNHLLYSGFGYLVYNLLHSFGLTVRSLTALQIVNVLASVLCATAIFRLCTRLFRSSELSVSCTLLFALGATWWRFSTDADSYILAVFFLLAAVASVLGAKPHLVGAGVWLTSAMLFHQLAIFGYVPLLVALWHEPRTRAERLRRALAFVSATGACVATAYYIAYAFTHPGSSPQSFLAWVTSVSNDTKTTSSLEQLVVSNLSSYLKLFGGGKIGLLRDFVSPPVVLALIFSVGCVATGVARLFRRQPTPQMGRPEMDRSTYLVLGSWIAAYLIFLSWFEPGNAFYKLFVWPPAVLLIGAYLNRKSSSIVDAFRWFALGLAGWNFAAFIYPHSQIRADPVLSLAKRIDQELPKSATVYYKALSPDDWYLEYFAPGRSWQPLPPASEIRPATGREPVCFETTALPYVQAEINPSLRWSLVNGQHNIRLECAQPKRN